MSTKKVTKKSEPVKAEVKKHECGTVKLADGTEAKREGVFVIDKEGNLHRCPAEQMLKANTAAMTIEFVDTKTGEKGRDTYGVHWHKTGNGGYSFSIATADGLVDETTTFDDDKSKTLTLIGRGNARRALRALDDVWLAFATQFGIQHAYKIVRFELGYKDKNWHALIIPVTEVMA